MIPLFHLVNVYFCVPILYCTLAPRFGSSHVSEMLQLAQRWARAFFPDMLSLFTFTAWYFWSPYSLSLIFSACLPPSSIYVNDDKWMILWEWALSLTLPPSYSLYPTHCLAVNLRVRGHNCFWSTTSSFLRNVRLHAIFLLQYSLWCYF